MNDSGQPHAGSPDLLTAVDWPGAAQAEVELRETHASWVFLAGNRAFKVCKPVKLAFLDYSTLERRHAACREQVRCNRELADDIYLGVRALVLEGTRLGLAPEDAPGAVEYAVEMRRFDERQTLLAACQAGGPTREQMAAIGRRLAQFHRAAAVVPDGTVAEVRRMWDANLRELRELRGLPGAPGPDRWIAAAAFGEAFLRRHERELRERVAGGLIRDGHGDLRCEHVLLAPALRIVDRIEFDRRLRYADVASDLAFLVMDLGAHGCGEAANWLQEAYRAAGGDPGSPELLAFYAAHRALVRAKVALVAASQHDDGESGQAEALWQLGERLAWRARRPLMVVVGGIAASGKSSLASALGRESGLPVIASDSVRKLLADLAPTERAGTEHYTEQVSARVYEELGRQAADTVQEAGGAIVDATCHRRFERDALRRGLGSRPGPAPVFIICQVPLELAIERAGERLGQRDRVSDATPEVVREQAARFEPPDEIAIEQKLTLDTAGNPDASVRALGEWLDGRGAPRRPP